MAKPVSKIIIGIDVSKDHLVTCEWHSERIVTHDNRRGDIQTWLKSLCGPVQIAIEPTAEYHLEVVDVALELGHEVFLVNPRQLAHYRRAVHVRHKTDPVDAWLLARFLAHEGHALRPFQPQRHQARQLWALLKRRAKVVATRRQLQQSLKGVHISIKALNTQFQRLLERIDLRILKLIRALGWKDDFQRCLSIPGIGKINAAALVAAWHRGAFASSDAFIAYLGMDVRIRQSGQYRGQAKLTKHGESELRRLLFCAAQPARSYHCFESYYQRQLNKGLPKTAAKVIVGRKLARIAFALMKNQQTFIRQELPAG